jgi:hypothetical protein
MMTYRFSSKTNKFEQMTADDEAEFNKPRAPEEAESIRRAALAHHVNRAINNNGRLDSPLGKLFKAEGIDIDTLREQRKN